MTYAEARAELFNLKGVSEDGSGRRQWGAFTNRSNVTAGGQVRNKAQRPGFYDTQYGVAPTEAEVQAYWKANGGGKGKKQRRVDTTAGKRARAEALAAAAAAAPPSEKSAYTQLLEEAAASMKSQTEKANAENLRRWEMEGQSHDDLYGRVMSGELDNWGNVQSQLNASQAQQNLDKINENLLSSGLSNSTNVMAAKLASDRNLALVQQDLSEKKSDRKVRYDMQLTGDKNDWIRSRFDNAPDPNSLMQVYAKLGEAEANDRARAAAAAVGTGKRDGSRRSLAERMAALGGGSVRGIPSIRAAQIGGAMAGNFYGGIAQGANYLNNINNIANYQPAWVANAFPHRPGESRWEAYLRRMG